MVKHISQLSLIRRLAIILDSDTNEADLERWVIVQGLILALDSSVALESLSLQGFNIEALTIPCHKNHLPLLEKLTIDIAISCRAGNTFNHETFKPGNSL